MRGEKTRRNKVKRTRDEKAKLLDKFNKIIFYIVGLIDKWVMVLCAVMVRHFFLKTFNCIVL